MVHCFYSAKLRNKIAIQQLSGKNLYSGPVCFQFHTDFRAAFGGLYQVNRSVEQPAHPV
jgi:hypothetical protein